jgi:hypothetical protein
MVLELGNSADAYCAVAQAQSLESSQVMCGIYVVYGWIDWGCVSPSRLVLSMYIDIDAVSFAAFSFVSAEFVLQTSRVCSFMFCQPV